MFWFLFSLHVLAYNCGAMIKTLPGLITLTTDFGDTDGYVASVKGVILKLNPEAKIVDISHSIQPQNILQAAYIIYSTYKYFEQNTIHVVIVDPGVGSGRKAVIYKNKYAYFIAPDNGVLSYIIQPDTVPYKIKEKVDSGLYSVLLGKGNRAIEIKNTAYWLLRPSKTFHGRDIFAPVAAHLSRGISVNKFGPQIESLNVLNRIHPEMHPDGTITGHIIHIDHFGNLITNIKSNYIKNKKKGIKITIKETTIKGLSQYYAERKGIIALIGSSNHLEIALHNGSAQKYFGSALGDEVIIQYQT